MFIVSITYKVDLEHVEPHMEGHIAFLNVHYENGYFIASGRKIPRTGGVILAKADTREDLERVLQQDPFYTHDIAEFDVTEFIATKTAEGFDSLQKL